MTEGSGLSDFLWKVWTTSYIRLPPLKTEPPGIGRCVISGGRDNRDCFRNKRTGGKQEKKRGMRRKQTPLKKAGNLSCLVPPIQGRLAPARAQLEPSRSQGAGNEGTEFPAPASSRGTLTRKLPRNGSAATTGSLLPLQIFLPLVSNKGLSGQLCGASAEIAGGGECVTGFHHIETGQHSEPSSASGRSTEIVFCLMPGHVWERDGDGEDRGRGPALQSASALPTRLWGSELYLNSQQG